MFTNKLSNFIAAILLVFMFLLMIFSVVNDSATMDEVAHLPSGYSYIVKQDMRLNPEHPPLMKDMAGLGALLWSKISGQPINFPENIKSWQEEVNGQWDFGFNFLYRSDNNADKMIFWGRFPLILLTILLGLYVFKWARQLFGNRAALLALALFSLSPTFIAHGRLITTDVAATAAIFVGLYYFVKWLKSPTWKNLIIAGLVFGIAQLMKFSVFLLVPLFFFIALAWLITKKERSKIVKYLGGCILIMVIGYVLIVGPVYQYHVWRYPVEKQINDIKSIFSFCDHQIKCYPVKATIWMAQQPILRPWSQYLFGLLMVFQRATGGNTTYFMGEVSNTGWWYYFPIVYALKEPLAMHILSIIALIYAACLILKSACWKKPVKRFLAWLNQHLAEFSMLSFIVLYWLLSIKSPLNIGVRHVLPTFPFIYLLVSRQIVKWLKIKLSIKTIMKYALVFILLLWQFVTIVLIYPHYISYFNEIAGGPKTGYRYAVDSNLDWGQDLKRLAQWVDKNNIDKIYVDYFGGGLAEYYLNDKYLEWHGDYAPEEITESKYLAISVSFLQNDLGQPVPGFDQPSGYYLWLSQREPITTIGNSIFVYKIN